MEIKEIVENLEEIGQDSTVPKNLKAKIDEIISELNSSKDLSLKVNKSLSELDEICEEVNIPPFVRTQLWSVSSMLERLA